MAATELHPAFPVRLLLTREAAAVLLLLSEMAARAVAAQALLTALQACLVPQILVAVVAVDHLRKQAAQVAPAS